MSCVYYICLERRRSERNQDGPGTHRDIHIQPVPLLEEFWAEGQLGQPFHAQHMRPSARQTGQDEGAIVLDPYAREVAIIIATRSNRFQP